MNRLALIALGLFCFVSTALATVPATERDALVALHTSANGASWTVNTNWLTGDPCADNWYGVICDSSGNIVTVALENNNLMGTIPTGLGNLANLKELFFYKNQLSGAIPTDLGNLSNLTYLDLADNQLSGVIPVELGNLTNLLKLNLSTNQLSGVIPAQLGDLSNLIRLYLAENQLSGPIPADLGKLTKLWQLYLQTNRLTGPIPPALRLLTDLKILYLQGNELTGPIPANLGMLENLTHLYLHANQLSGPIPVEFGNLSSMKYLYLYANRLSGPIPVSITNLTNLIRLKLLWNGLYSTNAALDTFLDAKADSNWHSTQTIAPESPYVSGVSLGSVTLGWDPIEYTQNDGGYRVWYGTSPGGPYMNGGITADKISASHTVSGLVSGKKYYFVIRTGTMPHSLNTNKVVSDKSPEVFTSTAVLAQPTVIRATDGSFSDRVRVTFNTVAEATVYRVFRCPDKGNTCGLPIGYPKTGSFDDRKAVPGIVYYYRVRACTTTTCGRFSAANSGFASTAPPSPAGVNATDGIYVNRVKITWNTVNDATAYRVYRCMDNTLNCGTPIGYPKTSTFNDLKGTPEQVYYYRVKACAAKCSDFSAADTGFGNKQLDRPTGIRATDGSYQDRVEVTFNAVEGAAIYRVFRCMDTGQTCGLPIGFPKTNFFNDRKGDPDTVYYYRVRACTPDNCSLFSVANSGHRGSISSTEGDENAVILYGVPIPAMADLGRFLLILLVLGLGLSVINREYLLVDHRTIRGSGCNSIPKWF